MTRFNIEINASQLSISLLIKFWKFKKITVHIRKKVIWVFKIQNYLPQAHKR